MVMPSNKQASENTSSRQTINNESTETAENSDKLSDKPWYELTKDIIIPVAVFILGAFFTWSQFKITSDKQKSDDTAKDTETKEQVLTDYGKTIAELVTKNKLDKEGDNSVKNIARGQTLIALRRLNVADKNGKADESKDEAGKLKGLLIRYLTIFVTLRKQVIFLLILSLKTVCTICLKIRPTQAKVTLSLARQSLRVRHHLSYNLNQI
jgi:hypothetical protein